MSGPRKYFTEIALIVCTEGSVLFRPSIMGYEHNMGEVAQGVLNDASIYFVCSRPRIRIEPGSIDQSTTDLHYDLSLHTQEGRITEHVTYPDFFARYPDIEVVRLQQPHTFNIEVVSKGHQEGTYFPVELFIPSFAFNQYDISSYETLYIGQSQVGKASGNILSRLKRHSTLQKILADLQANEPHREPFLMCFVLDDPKYMLAMNPEVPSLTSDDEDMAHILHAYENPPSPAQLTSIAEAGYIRYFQPRYNLMLKDSFPSTNLKLLQSCYDLDFSALSVEVNVEDLQARVFSEKRKPHFHHIATFDLHEPEERMSFFHASSKRDGLMVDLRDDTYFV